MKYLSLLVALIITSNASFAETDRPERPDRPTPDAVIERIKAALEGDISDRKKAYLQHRLAYMELHTEIRVALRDAMTELGKDATDEQRKAAHLAIREQFSERMQEIKDVRRDAVIKRRANRRDSAATDG